MGNGSFDQPTVSNCACTGLVRPDVVLIGRINLWPLVDLDFCLEENMLKVVPEYHMKLYYFLLEKEDPSLKFVSYIEKCGQYYM